MGEGFIGLSGIAIVDLSQKRAVSLPDGVPNNNGAFAPGIVAGDRLFVGGQLGRDPVRQLVPENPDEQVTIALYATPSAVRAFRTGINIADPERSSNLSTLVTADSESS